MKTVVYDYVALKKKLGVWLIPHLLFTASLTPGIVQQQAPSLLIAPLLAARFLSVKTAAVSVKLTIMFYCVHSAISS